MFLCLCVIVWFLFYHGFILGVSYLTFLCNDRHQFYKYNDDRNTLNSDLALELQLFLAPKLIYLCFQTIATVCMFLAGKVEETPRPLKDVILVSYEIIHKKDPAAVQRIKQKVLCCVSAMLLTLIFLAVFYSRILHTSLLVLLRSVCNKPTFYTLFFECL